MLSHFEHNSSANVMFFLFNAKKEYEFIRFFEICHNSLFMTIFYLSMMFFIVFFVFVFFVFTIVFLFIVIFFLFFVITILYIDI
jgi:hypothetical protein